MSTSSGLQAPLEADRSHLAAEQRASLLRSLYESGRVTVAVGGLATSAPPVVLPEVEQALREADALARSAAPGEAPELDLAAAAWGLERILVACRACAERSLPSEEVKSLLSEALPGERTPSLLWSVDLCLRYLPDLYQLARGIAQDDPLVASLEALARDWPLSAVGIPCAAGEPRALPPLLRTHPTLRGLLVDRILERACSDFDHIPWVREAQAVVIGAHPEIDPKAVNR